MKFLNQFLSNVCLSLLVCVSVSAHPKKAGGVYVRNVDMTHCVEPTIGHVGAHAEPQGGVQGVVHVDRARFQGSERPVVGYRHEETVPLPNSGETNLEDEREVRHSSDTQNVQPPRIAPRLPRAAIPSNRGRWLIAGTVFGLGAAVWGINYFLRRLHPARYIMFNSPHLEPHFHLGNLLGPLGSPLRTVFNFGSALIFGSGNENCTSS